MNINKSTTDLIQAATKTPEGNQRFLAVAKIITDVYNEGRRSGHIKAVKICKNALDGLENATSSTY